VGGVGIAQDARDLGKGQAAIVDKTLRCTGANFVNDLAVSRSGLGKAALERTGVQSDERRNAVDRRPAIGEQRPDGLTHRTNDIGVS
jgi:hypothetical protein